MCECEDGYIGALCDERKLRDAWVHIGSSLKYFWYYLCLAEAIPCTLPDGSMVDDGASFKSGNPCMPDW